MHSCSVECRLSRLPYKVTALASLIPKTHKEQAVNQSANNAQLDMMIVLLK